MKTLIRSVLLAVIGVFVIDYFSHLFFSNPMETLPYFLAKLTLYIVYSIIVLSFFRFRGREFLKVVVAGIIVASLWGIYYNILPPLLHFYPFGIPLGGISFLGMGLLGSGIAFGTVHTVAFVGGYYATKFLKR